MFVFCNIDVANMTTLLVNLSNDNKYTSYLSLETTIGPDRLLNPPPPVGVDGAPAEQPGPANRGVHKTVPQEGITKSNLDVL